LETIVQRMTGDTRCRCSSLTVAVEHASIHASKTRPAGCNSFSEDHSSIVACGRPTRWARVIQWAPINQY